MERTDNKDRQQCPLSLVVKSRTANLFPGQGTKPADKECNIKENIDFKSKLA